MKFLSNITILTLSLLFYGCEILNYHPYSGEINGETGLTEKNLTKISENLKDKASFKFAFISDTQGFFDETRAFVKSANARGDIDMVLHGGDLTDFALPSEFELMRDELSRLRMPWLTAIGNHDCLANGEKVFRKIFGETDYCFRIGNNIFIILNTNALEYDYKNIPNMEFLRETAETFKDITTNSSAKTFIIMHSHPGDDQFNNAALSEFRQTLKLFPNVVCLSGHTHHLEQKDCLGDGTPFFIISEIKKRNYYVFSINPEGYEVEECRF